MEIWYNNLVLQLLQKLIKNPARWARWNEYFHFALIGSIFSNQGFLVSELSFLPLAFNPHPVLYEFLMLNFDCTNLLYVPYFYDILSNSVLFLSVPNM